MQGLYIDKTSPLFSKTTARVDFGVAFSINFFSSSAFLGLRKALEQDAMSSSVSVVRRTEKFQTRVRFDFLTSLISHIIFFS